MYILILLILNLIFLPIKAIDDNNNSNFIFKILTDDNLQSIKEFFIQQRIEVFKEYPYLYEGNFIEGSDYFNWFCGLKHSAIVVAYLKNETVGFLSGTSFVDFDQHFQGSIDLFKKNNLDTNQYFYFSEIIILPKYRGNHLSYPLFAMLEQYAQSLGYKSFCFVAESHEKHPLKPTNYKEQDILWKKLNYKKTGMSIKFSWSTIQFDGQTKSQEHKMIYWIK